MEPFVVLEGIAAPLDQPVDTDQIMPARFLRRPRGSGYQHFLFHDLRFNSDGSENPEFILNKGPYRQARILVADRHFGTGSSREQAPWGLMDYGIGCVIAADFGEIFYLNSIKTGLLPVQLSLNICISLRDQLRRRPGATIRAELSKQIVTAPDGSEYFFQIDPFHKHCLTKGLDDISLTLQHEGEILKFEESYRQKFDWFF